MPNIWKIVREIFGGEGNRIPDEDISKKTLTYIERDDPEMVAAWKKARNSVNEFLRKMSEPQFADADFYVKKRFDQGDRCEHINRSNS